MLVADHVPGHRFGRAEVDCSRARVAAAADEARKQLERDLHDGAQQRFVSASLWLKRAAEVARGTPAERFVTEAYEEIQQGLAELRDLAGGIHPGQLTERGLGPALQGLAGRSPLPVELRVTSERAAPAVEAAIYFTVAEALTNVARHAQATRAAVTIEASGGMLTAEVADDGVGGACASGGSGLSGLGDRLSRLGGTLSVESPPGGPTRIAARVPLLPHA